MAEKVTTDQVEARTKAQLQPGWRPKTLAEAALSAEVAVHNYAIQKYETEISDLKVANNGAVTRLDVANARADALEKIIKQYEKELGELKRTHLEALRETEKAWALYRILLQYIAGHPDAKGIDFGVLFSS